MLVLKSYVSTAIISREIVFFEDNRRWFNIFNGIF